MHKQEILTLLKTALEAGTVTADEVAELSEDARNHMSAPEARIFQGRHRFSAASVLYLIGGIIVLVGIGAFVYNFWGDLSGTIRILITLGFSIAAYSAGILLRDNEGYAGIATVMQFIGGVLAPIGMYVTLDVMNVQDIGSLGWSTAVFGSLFLIYGISFVLFRSSVFALFTTLFGITTVYSSTAYSLDITGQNYLAETAYKYLTLALGTGLMFLGNAAETGSQRILRGFFYWLGAFGVYTALLTLGGYQPDQSYLWEALNVVGAIGGLYLASVTHNRSLLKATALFIFIIIGKFTAEYFAGSLGWPIALIIGGFVIIAAGFGIVRFGKGMEKSS